MAIYAEGTGFAGEAEPIGLLTEGAAGIAVIVLAVIALAGVSVDVLASVLVIVAGIGFMLQAFNSTADHAALRSRLATAAEAAAALPQRGFGSEAAVDCLCGLAVLILGILALVGVKTADLLPPALIVSGAALMVGGALGSGARRMVSTAPGDTRLSVAYQGTSAAGGMEVLIGLAAIVLGILAVLLPVSAVLVLVGFIAVGAALLLVSASFSNALMRLFTAV